jgi:4a-hydroxytetrahydrobiopterin dehydratase
MSELNEKKCVACEGGIPPLSAEKITEYLAQVPGWSLNTKGQIQKDYQFKNFYHTMAFVNAMAWIAHQENHHPDLEIGFNYCRVFYSTHAINGLSENDFICAAKINTLHRFS